MDDVLDRGLDALLSKDYAAAAQAFLEARAIDPEHHTVVANLKRLVDLGHLSDSELASAP